MRTSTMGACLALISPKLGHSDVTDEGVTSPGTDTGSLHRHRHNPDDPDLIIPEICHLHRDSLVGLGLATMGTVSDKSRTSMARCAGSRGGNISDGQCGDIITAQCDAATNATGVCELFSSTESVFTTSSLDDEVVSDPSYEDLINVSPDPHELTDPHNISTRHPRPSKTKALLEEFDASDRIKAGIKGMNTATNTESSRCSEEDTDRAIKSRTNSRQRSETKLCEQTDMRMSSSGRERAKSSKCVMTKHSHRQGTRPCDKAPEEHGKSSSKASSSRVSSSKVRSSRASSIKESGTRNPICGQGEHDELQDLVTMACKEGRTLLHNAAHQGDVHLVTRLLQCGANVNARDLTRRTPLHEVSDMGHVTTGRVLLEYGAKVNARDKWKCTPLHQAVAWKQAKMVRLLLQHDARATGGTLLQDVINMDPHDDVIIKLIARGADVNATDMTGQTPMHTAVKYGRVQIVWLLVEAGANVNKVSRGMMEVNHGAVLTNARRQLVPLGLDGLLQDGWSPLRMAQKYKHFDLVVWLIKCGANIVVCDSTGRFPHHKATTQRNCPSLHHIVANPNCPIDIRDVDGNTAIKLNFEAHAKCMVDANPQCGCCSNQPGTTPAPSCDEYANTTLLLLQHGADVTDLYIHGYDLLYHLCSSKFNYDLRLLQGVLNSGNDLHGMLSSAQSCLNALKRQLRLDMYDYLEYFVNHPRTLQDQCRLSIRTTLRCLRPGRSIWTGITSLPLPDALVDFLLLQPLQGATLTRHFPVARTEMSRRTDCGRVTLCELVTNPTHSLC